MPRKPIDYSNTHFYKIVCKDINIKELYVGHTTNFKNRKLDHKKNCLNPNSKKYNFPIYCFVRENGGWENWDMILIDKKECCNELEALKYEREYMESMNASLNRYKPYRNQEDWDEKQRKRNEHIKQDRKDNPEKYKQIDKLNYEQNKEKKIKRASDYYNKYKDYLNKKKAERYENNKEYTACECGSTVLCHNFQKHLKTPKHQQYLQSLQ